MTKTPAIPLLALGAAALLALSCGGDGGGTRLPTAPPPAPPAPAPPPPEPEPDPFDPKLWRELVFGAHLCPSDTTDAGCIEAWFGMPVEERTTRLLAAIPSFNILTLQDPPAWAPAEPLTGGQRSTLEELIPRVVEQLTGEAFSGEVAFGNEWKEEAGWVDVTFTGGEFWRERFGSEFVCTAGLIGADPGQIAVNMDMLEDAACGGLARVLSHSTGVALGFSAVEEAGHLMSSTLENRPSAASEAELYHAQLAWKLGRGAPYTDDPR